MSEPAYILAVDCGASKTRTRLAVTTCGESWEVRSQEVTESIDAERLKDSVVRFARGNLPRGERIASAVVGIPGRISGDRLCGALTFVDPHILVGFGDLFEDLDVGQGFLMNDLECGASAIPDQGAHQLRWLCGKGGVADTRRFILGMPGTGFGVGLGVVGAASLSSEGGHIAAARALDDEIEERVFRDDCESALAGGGSPRLPSYEDLVCGPGIARIFNAVVHCRARGAVRDAVVARLTAVPPEARPIAISGWANAGEETVGTLALETFRYYGKFLGRAMQSLAVVTLPTAVFLGGSVVIAAHSLFAETFVASFVSHGVHSEFLSQMPVLVAMNPQLNLDGATRAAVQYLFRDSAGASE
jgi:glucokinase